MNQFILKSLLFIFLAMMLFGCGEKENKKVDKKDREKVLLPVRVEEARSGIISRNIKVQGRLEAMRNVLVVSEVDGRIDQRFIEESQSVTKNQLLIQLSTPPGKTLALEKVRLRRDQASLKIKRLLDLQKKAPDAISLSDIEDSELNLRELEIELQSGLEEADLRSIRAPFSGVVIDLDAEQGKQLGRGQGLAKLLDVNKLQVKVQVPEANLELLHIGMKASLTLLSNRKNTEAEIVRLPSAINPNQGTGEVVLQLNTVPKGWRPGAFVILELNTGEFEADVLVSRKAIMYHKNRPYLWVANPKNHQFISRKIFVELGEGDKYSITVRRGLHSKDLVIVGGTRHLSEGMSLEIIKASDSKLEKNKK